MNAHPRRLVAHPAGDDGVNPHDPTERPGAHLVAEQLGVTDPYTLNTTYRPADPLYPAATRVIGAAHELDELHNRVSHTARAALEALEPVARGEFTGAPDAYEPVRSAVRHIEQLTSRQNRAYGHLTETIFAYRRLLAEANAAQPSHAESHGQSRGDDWAVAGERGLDALRAVEAGELRLHRSAVYGYAFLSDGQGQSPDPSVWPETVQRLVTEGLLEQDTRESLYRPGQLLSLTALGQAALRDARATQPRVSAALSRSNTSANHPAIGDGPPAPAPETPNKPSRSC
ncbi:large ATP-binding protein [Streptomyces buecherae]|uniref:Large ATP-binding protein n=1 Tax=Streptomyces buecherae TaxID=2763006 RepID=A0A7H8NGQ2_9ACTN|nr:large ATP-binding protein [Streptomyces buecherae]QKW53590.1 large ATP-binding protein [Streptomyces buecherae]